PCGVGDTVEVRWRSGSIQTFTDVGADQRLTITEEDGVQPKVVSVSPANATVDTPLFSNVVIGMSKAIDPDTVSNSSISLFRSGVKAAGSLRVSSDRLRITFDPDGPLDADADYQIQVTSDLKDLFQSPAVPFASIFDTGTTAASIPLTTDLIGTQQTGTVVGGANVSDHFGFSAAALGDVNGDGAADIIM